MLLWSVPRTPPTHIHLAYHRYATPPVTGHEQVTKLRAGSTITLTTSIMVPLQQVEDTPLWKVRRLVGQKRCPVEGTLTIQQDLTQEGVVHAVAQLSSKLQEHIDQLEQAALQQLFAYGALEGRPVR